MASGLFRFMGALGRNIIVANTFGSFALLAVLVMGGFVLSRGESASQFYPTNQILEYLSRYEMFSSNFFQTM